MVLHAHRATPGGRGQISCEKSVDVPWKIGLKQGKDTNLGVAQVLFDPYKIP